MLSDYNLTYHCKVKLLYCNPYLTLTVHYLTDTSDIDIDSTLPAESILSCFVEVGSICWDSLEEESILGVCFAEGSRVSFLQRSGTLSRKEYR